MVFLSKKNGNIGELVVVVTELDRAQHLVMGHRWLNINDSINSFNKDPDVNQLRLSAVYAGDLKDEKLNEFVNSLGLKVCSNDDEEDNDDNKKKQKVTPSNKNVDEPEEKDDPDEVTERKEFLSQYDLTCSACSDEGKALVDADGHIHHCEACIKIDAYIKGKKEGFEEGYEKGYAECIKHLKMISEKVDVTVTDSTQEDKPTGE